MNKTKTLILVIGLVVLLTGAGVGVFLVTQPTGFSLRAQNKNLPQGVKVVAVTDEMVKVEWMTEEPTQSLVYYGLNSASLTLVQSEATATGEHAVELAGLLPSSTYFFTINVGKERFTNDGPPWQFKTLARQGGVTPTLTPSLTLGPVTAASLKGAMGTSEEHFDLNGDGSVNLVDLRIIRDREATKSASVTPTGKASK